MQIRNRCFVVAALFVGGLSLVQGAVAAEGDAKVEQSRPASLGVRLKKSDAGVSISLVIPGSPAERAGLRVGDEIRAVGDERIGTPEGLSKEIQQQQPGAVVELTIRRNGERQIIKAKLAADDAVLTNRQTSKRPVPTTSNVGVKSNADPNSDQRVQDLQAQLARLQRDLDELLSAQKSEQATDENMQNPDWGWDGTDNQGHDPDLFQ